MIEMGHIMSVYPVFSKMDHGTLFHQSKVAVLTYAQNWNIT